MEQLFRDGITFFIHPFKVYYQVTTLPAEKRLQAAFGVSSRTFKKAVDRNRIKRLMREAYRVEKKALQQQLQADDKGLAVFFLYTGKELPDLGMVKDKMKLILEKLERLG